ncbi:MULTISPECIES: bifunctional precorrin-2 dehydrogenase/sirohydrochlorin ferrochelatase [unclassified Fusibacter]|uniref:precorrin-2 dehydrogenase/sirohydrochlorin ferrochelatase family protein n=1 Tax=unclassified Fusibacter TaxID=2624464 RepID=UPI0013E905E1|nr:MULTISPECIES: bifunctional precorrin-2 dehydrogenase/sirohydrochlorin ferrochelatase [unclassified Fusibacter]MCK8060519.1 bifunctional precorrin-2 dehydrogenase/sirohydrochlorin ferrochelatase [Fusibacter sp. A2]NPE20192.1 bifunctional precorrin-2 dehydrogenase/sirohydrochlorin ferrochelatase [Fusibacter sp. A1]
MIPIMIDVKGKPVLIVGYGAVGRRKAELFLTEGAQVYLYDLQASLETSGIPTVEDVFSDDTAYFMVVVCTDDRDFNHRIVDHFKNKALVNVADSPEDSCFHNMASVRRGELTVAVSTNGGYPGVGKRIKNELENFFEEDYGCYLAYLAGERKKYLSLEEAEKKRQLDRLLAIDYKTYKKMKESQCLEN